MQLVLCDSYHPRETASLCKSTGFGIEVQSFIDPTHATTQPSAIGEHRALLAGIFPTSLHGAFEDLVPASKDAMIRNVARVRFDQSQRVASALGTQNIVLHHGYVPRRGAADGWIARSTEFWRAFLDAHGDQPQRVHVENVRDDGPEVLRSVVETVAHPRIGLCLDVGHVHCHSPKSPPEWIRELRGLITYVHLHNNDGTADQHRAISDGTLPMRETLDALLEYAPRAIWALEVTPDLAELSIQWLQDNHYLP